MKHPLPRIYFLLFCCLFSPTLSQVTMAQVSFQIGYGFGNWGNSLNEFRNEIHYLNEITYPNHTESLQAGKWVKGVSFGYQVGGDEIAKPYFFMTWNNEHLIARGNLNNADYALKYRHNNFDVCGLGYRLSKHIGVAICPASIGTIKIFKKEGDGEWNAFYDVRKGLLSNYVTFGGSLHLDYIVTNKIWIRTGYYFDYAPVTLRDASLTEHAYGAARFTVQLNYLLHKQ